MRYKINIPKELGQYKIPKITIQPLVENALYHGIKNKRGIGEIKVSGWREENFFIICVEDDGIGIDEKRLAQIQGEIKNGVRTGEGIYGLYNVNERIRLNFGEEYGITIESIYGEKTVVRIKLPCVE